MNPDKFDQLQANLLTSLILALLPVGLVASLLVEYRQNGVFNLFSPLMVLMYVGYILIIGLVYSSRPKQHRLIFLIVIGLAIGMILTSTQLIDPTQAQFPLYYLLIPVLLTTIFFTNKEVSLISLLILLLAFVASFFLTEIAYTQIVLGPLLFLIFSFIALIISNRYREILEENQRNALEEKEILQLKRANEFMHLHQASLELTQELDQKDALQTIVNRAAALLGLKMGEILLFNGQYLRSIATTPDAPWQPTSIFTLALDQGLSGKVALTKKSVMVSNYAEWSERVFDPLFDEVKRAIAVPLLYEGEVLGVINIFDVEKSGDFTEDEVRLLEMFAAQAAIVIQNVRWQESLEQAKSSLEREVAEQTRHLREARDRLLQLDRLRAKMMDDISHELRTPITNLVLYADLMEKGSPEKQARYLSIIKRESNHLSDLVERILRLSHMDMAKDSVLSEGLALNQIVAAVVEQMAPEATAVHLTLSFAPQRPLPTILGNEKQLHELMENLLQNSILYSVAGDIVVKTAVAQNSRYVQLIVQDSGIGIPENEQAKVFDRLYRGTAVGQRNIRGVGLGLAVVKDIVDLHRGHIELQSEVGVGTTITIELPTDQN